jgi:lambda family phage portal protein
VSDPKPKIRLKADVMQQHAGTLSPMRGGNAFNASSLVHPDLRNWQPWPGSPDSDLLPELPIIRSRARDLTRNNGLAAGALQTQLDNVLGCGLWLSPNPNYTLLGKPAEWVSDWSRHVKALWRDYSETTWCDAGKSLTLDGLALQMFAGAWTNGDGIALPLWMPEPFAPSSTRVQVIESDRLGNPYNKLDTARLRGGVEIDDFGAPIAYWIRKAHPGDSYFYMYGEDWQWERIPAATAWGRKRVIHAHDKARAGQSRGIPALAATMSEFKVLKDYRSAELKAAVVNAMVSMVIESSMGQEQIMELLSSDSDALKTYMDGLAGRKRSAIDFGGGGMIVPLPLGDKLHSFSPARPSVAYDPFVTTAARYIGAGLNMPYELVLKDFSKSNYSSARAALVEAWRSFTGRRDWIGRNFYQPVYDLWFEEMVDAGKIEAPGFYENRAAWTRARWIGPGRGWIDPLKEAQAAELRMDIMVSTLEDECAEQGKDWEEVLEQRAIEQTRLKKLGLDQVVLQAKKLRPKGDPSTDGGDGSAPEDGKKSGAPAEQGAIAEMLEGVTESQRDIARALVAQAERPLAINFPEGAIQLRAGDVHAHISRGGKINFTEDERGNLIGAELEE